MTASYTFQAVSTLAAGGGLRSIPGATVTVYQTGTTTKAAIYAANGAALSNPAIADAYGFLTFYVAEGAYDVVAQSGSLLYQQTIVVTYPAARKVIGDANYSALASDGGVSFSALTAPRIVVLPPLATMAPSKLFPVSDESGQASASLSITIDAYGSDLINGSASATLVIETAYQCIAPRAGATSWMFV